MTEKFYLNYPFGEKDMCKSLWGRRDNDARMWFAPEDLDKVAFKRWCLDKDEIITEGKPHPRLVSI